MPQTYKTVLGYFGTRLRQRLGVESRSESLDNIFNYLKLDDRVATSGQPTVKQFDLIKAAGYELVINLAPASAENALGNEDEVLAAIDLEYCQKPKLDDFDRFIEVFEANQGKKVWVHCAANMRVSAFFFKYRTQRLGWKEDDALTDLHEIWQPIQVWQRFIDS
jgi:protein tyrosine phosphatase (PTP) superfamily phosphohydrolase (DUF442 family)